MDETEESDAEGLGMFLAEYGDVLRGVCVLLRRLG